MSSLTDLRMHSLVSAFAGTVAACVIATPVHADDTACIDYGQQAALHGKLVLESPCGNGLSQTSKSNRACKDSAPSRLALILSSPFCVIDNSGKHPGASTHSVPEIELDYPGHNPDQSGKDRSGFLNQPVVVMGTLMHGGVRENPPYRSDHWENDYVVSVNSMQSESANAQP